MVKRLHLALAVLAALALGISDAPAQTYPNRPVRIVVPFPAGGAVDAVARILSAKLQESLGQPVIVENRAGAGGVTGADAVAKSSPDGTTILQNTNGQAISPAIYRTLPFDTLKDFIPVTQLVATSTVLVANPKVPAKSVRELIALARANPGKLNYGMTGVGKVFEAYRDGLIEDDDEVAVLHSPEEMGYLQITEAMVKIGKTTPDQVHILFQDVEKSNWGVNGKLASD